MTAEPMEPMRERDMIRDYVVAILQGKTLIAGTKEELARIVVEMAATMARATFIAAGEWQSDRIIARYKETGLIR